MDFNKDLAVYLLSGLSVALVVAVITIIALAVVIGKMKKNQHREFADQTFKKHGERFSKEQGVIIDGQTKVTHLPKDIVLSKGRVYTVAKGYRVIPGQYTMLSADENDSSFTVKIDDVVKTYRHNCSIVLSAGSTISPRSGNVILR